MSTDVATLTWRPIADDDLEPWQELVEAVRAADDGPEHFTLDDLADELEAAWIDRARDTVLACGADGRPLAWGIVQVRPGDRTLLRAYSWGGVHPRARRRGIGAELLRRQEQRARELVAARRAALGEAVPAWFTIGVDERDTGTAQLATAAGLTPSRWSLTMRRDLAVPPEPVPVPEGLRLVPWSAELDDAVRHAHNEAFTDHWGFQPWTQEAWQQWESGHRSFRGDWSFVVLTPDGEVAGYAQSAGYEQDWAVKGYTEGWTGKLGVRRPWRGQGLAKVLLAASMRAFAEAGIQYAGLDVDAQNLTGAVALYSGLGYQVTRQSASWATAL